MASVLASMFGVQSSRRHAEDFTSRKATPYVVVGLVVTVVFVLTIWGVVQLVLSAAR
ncbi:MAG TPA: DUF2970 domain-containing protein [Gammaproteobacteria bacterium]|nr:DUF2970 domain-containing protein [Gammaproteobacteria bacterium]